MTAKDEPGDQVEAGSKGYDVPILFIVFNRPDTTTRVFDVIRKVRPRALYVAADGPRSGRDGERTVCDQVRAIATNVDWDCEVHTRFLDQNQGCKVGVAGAIDWFFSCVEEGVIIEDDCVPMMSFFPYCEELLRRYRDDLRVMHIGGYKPPEVGRDAYSYSFSRFTHIWGWASWRRAWRAYDINTKALDLPDMPLEDYEIFRSTSVTRRQLSLLGRVRKGLINTWDYQWHFCIRLNSGLCVRPELNLVENIGRNHPDGTHPGGEERRDETGDIQVPIARHPPYVLINRRLDRQYEIMAYRYGRASRIAAALARILP